MPPRPPIQRYNARDSLSPLDPLLILTPLQKILDPPLHRISSWQHCEASGGWSIGDATLYYPSTIPRLGSSGILFIVMFQQFAW